MKTTADTFLGGQLVIEQPARGYRAGVDPVFLAAAVPARVGQTVLELGCGVGVAGLCLAQRVPGVSVTGVEIDADTADIARRNAAANGVDMETVCADLAALPPEIRAQSYDHVIANPPYFRDGTQSDGAKGAARHEETPLAVWIDVAARRLKPKGRMTLILRADRLDDALASVPKSLGSVEIQPLAPRKGRDASLVLISAIKGGRAGLRLRSPFVLHIGDTHGGDGDDYSPQANAILRDGAALSGTH